MKRLPDFDTPPPERSRNMRAIRSKDTRPEIAVRRALHAKGLRFRLQRRDIPGNPDLVLPRFRTVIFVHGCFWHGHDCKVGHTPQTNSAYWTAKIQRNVARDMATLPLVERAGWHGIVIRECTLSEDIAETVMFLLNLKAKER